MKVNNICKSFGNNKVLCDVSFEASENIAIVGKSGVGKTTLLRILAGLEKADSGTIEYDGKIGFVFQDLNLFPHLNVWENVTLAAPNADISILEQLGIKDKAKEYPCNLSGGQKQRVAIARALALNPEYLCFDEPTSALDSALADSVAELINSLEKICIVVTHDMSFADKIAKQKIILGE